MYLYTVYGVPLLSFDFSLPDCLHTTYGVYIVWKPSGFLCGDCWPHSVNVRPSLPASPNRSLDSRPNQPTLSWRMYGVYFAPSVGGNLRAQFRMPTMSNYLDIAATPQHLTHHSTAITFDLLFARAYSQKQPKTRTKVRGLLYKSLSIINSVGSLFLITLIICRGGILSSSWLRIVIRCSVVIVRSGGNFCAFAPFATITTILPL